MKILLELSYFKDDFEKIKNRPKELVTYDNGSRVDIKIPYSHRRTPELLAWTKKYKRVLIGPGASCKKTYSNEELEQAEIFWVNWIDDAPGEMFADDYGTQYELIKKCKQYELKKQITPLFCNTSKLSKTKDIQKLFSSEIIISKRFKEIIEKERLTGVEICPVYRPTKIRDMGDIDEIISDKAKQSTDYFQLKMTANCGHIAAPPTVFGENFILLEKMKYINYIKECNLISGIDWQSSLNIDRNNWPKTDFAVTKELSMSEYPSPLIVISQKVYQIFKKNKIKGYRIEPAYFV